MAIDTQHFINQILSEQKISKRVLKISDVLSLTKNLLEDQDKFWIITPPSEVDINLVNRFSTNTPMNQMETIDNTINVTMQYATKIVHSYKDMVVAPVEKYPFQNREVTTSSAFSLYNSDYSVRPEQYVDTLVRLLIDNDFFDMISNLENFFGGVAISNLTFSGLFSCYVMYDTVIARTSQLQPISTVDKVQTIADAVQVFVNDEGMTLKNLQENVFFELFEEVV